MYFDYVISSIVDGPHRSRPEPGTDSESEAESDHEQLPKLRSFLKGWLKGAALQHALEEHYDTFFKRNSEDAKEGTAYAMEAANDMLKVFGIWGPWDTESKRLDEMSDYHPSAEEEEEEDDLEDERPDDDEGDDDRVRFTH